MELALHRSWKAVLASEFEKAYYQSLVHFVTDEYLNATCYPEKAKIFEAFNLCPFDRVEVVIIGQDPYHGPKQAHGLCFSVFDSVAFPPSLRNIFKEINDDLGKPIPTSGNLENWAMQGVLLLNATLTVREGQAGSHQGKGWEQFTDAAISAISKGKSNVVFMLWGGYAKKKRNLIDNTKHLILESGHPSPLSANQGHWFGNRHFSLANQWLAAKGLNEIEW